MEFSVGVIKSEKRVEILKYSPNNLQNSSIEIEDLKNDCIDALFLEDRFYNGPMLTRLKEESNYYPVRGMNDFGIDDGQTFLDLDFNTAQKVFLSANQSWALQNNINLIDELFPVLKTLTKLLKEGRTSFFEELWYILKSNLGTKELTIIFNDLETTGDDDNAKKNKIVLSKISGKKHQEFSRGEEIDKILMDNYKNYPPTLFEIVELDHNKKEIVILSKVNKGPILIMAKYFVFTPLQRVVIKSLFEGLNTLK